MLIMVGCNTNTVEEPLLEDKYYFGARIAYITKKVYYRGDTNFTRLDFLLPEKDIMWFYTKDTFRYYDSITIWKGVSSYSYRYTKGYDSLNKKIIYRDGI